MPLEFAQAKVETDFEDCNLCSNNCKITLIRTGEDVVGWGFKCGRDYLDKKPKAGKGSRYRLFKKHQSTLASFCKKAPQFTGPKVGMPRSLSTLAYLPLWTTFFRELEVPLELSKESTKSTLEDGLCRITAEFCAAS